MSQFAIIAVAGVVVRRQIAAGLILVTAISVLAACGGRGPVPALHEGLHTVSAEIAVADAVAAERGYPHGVVEVMVSRAQLRLLINDTKLAEADAATHAATAAAIVATAEKVLASDPEFPAIEMISVSIVHPAQLHAGTLSSHTEDVFEFRRGPDSRFSRRSE